VGAVYPRHVQVRARRTSGIQDAGRPRAGRAAGEPVRWCGVNTSIGSGYPADVLAMEAPMLYWALIFLLVALVAGLFGFGGIASASAGIAQILFFVFLVLLVISLVMYLVRGRQPPL
jgi:uncharacterized membrane protein YtjA (UPF0391 family)